MADDKDLRSFAPTPWRQIHPAVQTIAEGDVMVKGASATVVLGGYSTSGALRTAADLAARRPLLFIGAGAALALALYWQRYRCAGLAGAIRQTGYDVLTATEAQGLSNQRWK